MALSEPLNHEAKHPTSSEIDLSTEARLQGFKGLMLRYEHFFLGYDRVHQEPSVTDEPFGTEW